ncbi:MAG: M23 family metallopeptidase [Ruminococcus sp.]|nr:M23 family metallopeptidase [Ruminococcus sp.]
MSRVLINSENRITGKYTSSHKAVDLGYNSFETNNIVKAHSKGTIIELVDGKDNNKGSKGLASYGNYILIDHGNGYKTRYAHLKKNSFLVNIGDEVNKDTKLAIIGNSGNSYGRHLHFEVYENNKRINPTPYLTSDLPVKNTYQAHDKTHNWNDSVTIKTNPGTKYNEYAGWLGYEIDAIKIDNYTYRIHDMTTNKWSDWENSKQTGIFNHLIDGIQIKDASYRVHLKNGNWLSWINKVDDTSNGYAGIFNKPIDAFQMRYKKD